MCYLAEAHASSFDPADYGAKCDGKTDDTVSFTAAAQALMLSKTGGKYELPVGDCRLSSQIRLTLKNDQRLSIGATAMNLSRLHFVNVASSGIFIQFDSSDQGHQFSSGPSLTAENITCIADWESSIQGKCLSVVQSKGSGILSQLQTPATIRNVSAISGSQNSNAGDFANAVWTQDLARTIYERIYLWVSPKNKESVALSLNASVVQTTTIIAKGIWQRGGYAAITIGDYIQGLFVEQLQSLYAQHALVWHTTEAYIGSDQLMVSGSQLNDYGEEIIAVNVRHVQITGNYFLGGYAGWGGVSIYGNSEHIIANNHFLNIIRNGDKQGFAIRLVGGSRAKPERTSTGGGITDEQTTIYPLKTVSISGNTFVGFVGADSRTGCNIEIIGNAANVSVIGNVVDSGSFILCRDSIKSPPSSVGNVTVSNNLLGGLYIASGASSTAAPH